MPELSFEPLKVALSPPSGEKIDIIAEKSVIFWSKFPTSKCHKIDLLLVERSDLYERVQLDEYYQKILATYLDHSGNGGGRGRSFRGYTAYIVLN